MSDPFWLDDYTILFDPQKALEFVPRYDQSLAQKLNAIVRFTFYLAAILVIYTQNYLYSYLFVGGLVITYLIYRPTRATDEEFKTVLSDPEITVDRETHQLCQLPSPDNPFMNVLVSDYGRRSQRPPACSQNTVKDKIEEHFNDHLYRNVNDIWDRNNSQREFYTNPATTIPNDRDSWMKWCWKVTNVCKDGDQEACYRNQDVRDGRPHGKIFSED